MRGSSHKKGFIRIVLLAIVVIAALSYFNIDLKTFFETPVVKQIIGIFVTAWVSFIKPLLMFLYTSINGLFAR